MIPHHEDDYDESPEPANPWVTAAIALIWVAALSMLLALVLSALDCVPVVPQMPFLVLPGCTP